MAEESPPEHPSLDREGTESAAPTITIEEVFAELSTLADDAAGDVHDEVEDLESLLLEAHDRGLIDSGVRHLDARDAAEVFVGSVIFASPLLVEGGVFDIATHLLETRVAGVPVFLVANVLFVVLMAYALVEWTGRARDESRVLFEVLPVRVAMTLAIAFVVAAVLMTAWGRLDWAHPAEALARVSVLWTVGTIGGALGDVLSGDDAPLERASHPELATGERPEPTHDEASLDALHDGDLLAALTREFGELAGAVDDIAERREVTRLRELTLRATLDDAFNDRIRKYTTRDVAEAFVGSVIFAIPLLVEDGVFDVAAFFLAFRVAGFPVYFLFNAAFVVGMILALVYWAGPQDVQVTRPILGIVPRRLLGIAVVSLLTAAALMTLWGRVGDWNEPVVGLARVSVVWTVASFGAALGDILPGESSGTDLTDLEAIGDSLREDGSPGE